MVYYERAEEGGYCFMQAEDETECLFEAVLMLQRFAGANGER